jgi:hypothetical protein
MVRIRHATVIVLDIIDKLTDGGLQGYKLIDGRFVSTDWLAIVINPSFPCRLARPENDWARPIDVACLGSVSSATVALGGRQNGARPARPHPSLRLCICADRLCHARRCRPISADRTG